VLAIDDFGLRPMRSPQDEDFHDLIDARYERKTTLLTSNRLCGAPHNRFNAVNTVMRS
jgi:DNA replication protein DnaC